MNKLLTKIVGVALGATMAVGVGVGVAVNNNRGVVDSQVNAADGDLAFHFKGSTIFSGTSYASGSGTVNSQTANTTVSSATWQLTVGNNSAQLGTNAKVGNLSKETLGNGNFAAANGLASALGIESTTQKYAAAICTTGISNIKEIEVIYTGNNGGTPDAIHALSSSNGTNWTLEASKTSSIASGAKLSFDVNTTSLQYAFVADWSSTDNGGGLKGFELKLYEGNSTPAVTLTSITSVTGTVTALEKASDWDYTNISVLGNLSNGTIGADVKSYVNLTGDSVPEIEGNYTVSVTATSKTDNTVTLTANNISATVTSVPGYELVTSTSSIRNGTKIVIHSANDGKNGIMTSQASGYRNQTSFTVSDGFIPTADLPAAAEIITLVVSGSHWELKTSNNKYLSLTADDNKLYTSDNTDTTNNTTEWDISFSGNDAVIASVKYPSRVIRFNKNSGQERFACYTGTNQAIQMYALKDRTPYFSINTTQVYLGNRGTQVLKLTPHYDASDTVTWSKNNSIISLSATSGLEITITAADSGTANNVEVTATFASGNYETIVVYVSVIQLDMYVTCNVTAFSKVSSEPSGGWDGTYLLVDESTSEIFDGSASPLGANSEKSVTISNSTITATSDLISSSFNIKTSQHGYTIKSNSNYYFGNPEIKDKSLSTSIMTQYEVDISSNGVIKGVSSEDPTTTGTYFRHVAGDNIFRFYTSSSTGNAVALYKADGQVKAITSTLTSWYDNAKTNEYLVCNSSGNGSKIDWGNLYDSAIEMLTVDDLDTLENMTAKPSEQNGNFLEDFISDYDYLVAIKHYDDFLGRRDAGTLSVSEAKTNQLSNSSNTNMVIAIVITSVLSLTAVGGYFLLRKRKEEK